MKKIILIFIACTVPFIAFSQDNDVDVTNNGNPDNQFFGMYFDVNYLIRLNASIGVGFTFFNKILDFRVKYYPYVPSGDYSHNPGWGIGGELVASYHFNNHKFFNKSIGLGAGLTYFFMDDNYLAPSILGRWEIIRINIFPKWNYLKTFSLYFEPHLFFIPVIGEDRYRAPFTLGLGGRVNIF